MKKSISPYKLVFLSFLSLIIFGSFILWLPISTTEGHHLSYIDALFTSFSSICVTGLSTIPNLGQSLTVFGKIILAILMEIGGLGLITIATFFVIMIGNKIGMQERFLLKEVWNLNSLKGIVKLIRNIVFFTLSFQLCGSIINYIALGNAYPVLDKIGISIFHSISSFNNVGLDIFGYSTNMLPFKDNVLLNISTIVLAIFGGLGFLTIFDILKHKHWKKISLTAKIIVIATPILILSGTVLLYLFENGKINFLQSLLLSVSSRTAGFSSYNIAELSNPSIFLLIILMFIGGAPTSIAGGIKITTFVVIIIAIFSVATNRQTNLFKRHINFDVITKAFCLTLSAIFVILLSTFLISIFNPNIELSSILFEVVSSYSTSGLSLGITSSLSIGSKIVLMITMFIGRLGPLLLIGLLSKRKSNEKNDNIKYVEENITIG